MAAKRSRNLESPTQRRLQALWLATGEAPNRLLRALISEFIALGISASEFHELARVAFVELASVDSRLKNGRANYSRIAARTGLPRTAVKRALGQDASGPRSLENRIGVLAVLRAWHFDPRFLDSSILPSPLPLAGGTKSFKRLCKLYSPDIPHRATLSELTEMGLVTVADGVATVRRSGLRSLERRYRALVATAPEVERVLASVGSRSKEIPRAVRSTSLCDGQKRHKR